MHLLYKSTALAIKIYGFLTEPNMYPKEPYKQVYSSKTLRANSMYNAKLSGWQIAKRALIVYICFKQFLMIVLQYVHDILTIQLERKVSALEAQREHRHHHHHDRDALSTTNTTTSSAISGLEETLGRQIAHLEDQILIWKMILKSLGAPFVNMTLVVQCIQYYVIVGVSALIFSTEIYYRWIGPWNIGLIRLILNRSKEQLNIDQLARDECSKVIYASKCYATRRLEYQSPLWLNCKIVRNQNIYSQPIESKLSDHKMIIRLIKRFEQDGSLNLVNKRREWVNKICIIYSATVVGLLIGGFTIVLLFLLLWLLNYPSESLSLMDCVGFLEFELASFITAILLAFSAPQMMCVFIDQTYVAINIGQEIEMSIRRNEIVYQNINMLLLNQQQQLNPQKIPIGIEGNGELETGVGNRNLREAIELINENLLRVLMHYRLMKRHFHPMRHYYCHVTKSITAFYITYPVFVVFNLKYLDRISCLFVIGTVWAYLVMYDCLHLPICTYHAQLQHLFNRLFDLMGHVDRIQAHTSIYNPSIVSLVRLEVLNPEFGMDKLSIVMFSNVLNYKHLLRILFWITLMTTYGLLLNLSNESGGARRETSKDSMILGILG